MAPTYIFGSTLPQAMACCLITPSHYLNQYWLVIRELQWQPLEGNFTRDTSVMNNWNQFENYLNNISFKSAMSQESCKLPQYFPIHAIFCNSETILFPNINISKMSLPKSRWKIWNCHQNRLGQIQNTCIDKNSVVKKSNSKSISTL